MNVFLTRTIILKYSHMIKYTGTNTTQNKIIRWTALPSPFWFCSSMYRK